jgi:fido (protein-threonine AMPylation protein)
VRFFEDHEGFIRSEILRSYDRKDSQQVLQQALLSWRSELYSRNQAAILKWCNELLADSTGAVDKKICREVKSFTTYRQEILTTLDLLRKKTEVYLTSDLSLLIHDTILQKIFEHVGQLHNSAVSQLQDHLKMLEIENKALTVECKEAKRRTNKEDNDFQRTISELKEKLSLADVKYSLLEQGNE